METQVIQELKEIKNLTLLSVKTWLTIKDVEMLTGYKASYIHKLCQRNLITYSRPNGKDIFIKRSEIDEFMERGYIPSQKELLNEN